MWSLYENEKELNPLVFSNGKSQADIVKEVIESVKNGHKVIFIKGMCGTGKSAIALNLARKLGKTSIVVPIKSLQEQYIKDYSGTKYVLKDNQKLKILSILGRKNFKCKYIEENGLSNFNKPEKEKNTTLADIFEPFKKPLKTKNDRSCDNYFLPCKIEIKEKNLETIKSYIRKNPSVNISDFDSIQEIKRMTVAPVCPYWSPILSEDFEIKKFKDVKKIKYQGLKNKNFIIYQRKPGCPYYDQYAAYEEADVIIFNSPKYLIENLMDRKPKTEIDIIDECDDFLDSFANQEQISINRLLFSLSFISPIEEKYKILIEELTDAVTTIKTTKKYTEHPEEIYPIYNTPVISLLKIVLDNQELLDTIEDEEISYLNHLDKVAKTFNDFFKETFFSIEKHENDLIIHLVTTNLAKKLKELIDKNNVLIMMSGTIHSENVLKNIFGLETLKIIEAEFESQGELIKCKYGYEKDCSYASFKNNSITREEYLNSFSKCVSSAKKPILVHVTSFSDLPTDYEKTKFNLTNLPTQLEIIKEQDNDPFQKRVADFKEKKTDILFTTKCSRGIDFPGDICNSIIITRFPYPNISALFWKILKKTNPNNFMSFYMDKARRELLQKVYRGLRSKVDKVYLLSPDIRVLDFEIEKK